MFIFFNLFCLCLKGDSFRILESIDVQLTHTKRRRNTEKKVTKHKCGLLKNLYDANKCFVILESLKWERRAWQIQMKKAIFITSANIHGKNCSVFLNTFKAST